jgi:hypothetical protein
MIPSGGSTKSGIVAYRLPHDIFGANPPLEL